MSNTGKLVIITGKTASGKDTVIAKILEQFPNFKKVLTTTSRTPRNGEQNGVDYNFISEKEFINKVTKGEFLEHVKYGGNYYGTEKVQINPSLDLIWKIDPSMAGRAKEIFPESKIIYLNTPDQVVLERLEKRSINAKELQERMADDQEFWQQFKDKYDFTLENIPGKLSDTLAKIVQILEN